MTKKDKNVTKKSPRKIKNVTLIKYQCDFFFTSAGETRLTDT